MITHFLVPIQNFILIELHSRFIEHFLLYLNKETVFHGFLFNTSLFVTSTYNVDHANKSNLLDER